MVSSAEESLHLAEVTLRDLIADLIPDVQDVGLSGARLESRTQRREEERKRRVGAQIDERLLPYADFTDLEPHRDQGIGTRSSPALATSPGSRPICIDSPRSVLGGHQLRWLPLANAAHPIVDVRASLARGRAHLDSAEVLP